MSDMASRGTPVRMRRVSQAITFEIVFDSIAYWLSLAGVYVTVGFAWWMGAVEKLFAGPIRMPAGLAKAYAGTWVASFPGVDFLWGVIGVMELVIALVVIASIVSGEFL